MKELISKTRKSDPPLPGKILINEHEVSGKEEIANGFNTFLTNIDPELVKKVPNISRPFKSYFKKVDTTMPRFSNNQRDQRGIFFTKNKQGMMK